MYYGLASISRTGLYLYLILFGFIIGVCKSCISHDMYWGLYLILFGFIVGVCKCASHTSVMIVLVHDSAL